MKEDSGDLPQSHQERNTQIADPSPCDGCGLCCQHLLVEAYALDVVREPRIEIERPLAKRSVSLSVLDACWILTGPTGSCPFLNQQKRCDIYATRPNTCVSFMVGSHKCQELRRDYGLPPVVLPPPMHAMLAEIMVAAIAEDAPEYESP